MKTRCSSSGRTYRASRSSPVTQTSPTAIRSGYESSTRLKCRCTSCTPSTSKRGSCSLSSSRPPASSAPRVTSGRPGSLAMPCATSIRKPSTPRSSQKRSVRSRSAATSGLDQSRSGCSAANRCRYHWPSGTRVQAGPPKRDCQLFGGSAPSSPVPSRKTYRRRAGLAGSATAATKLAWRSESWLGTRSMVTFSPCWCASATSASKPARSPRAGSTSRGSATS